MIGKSYGFENVFALSAATLSTDVPELVSPRANRQALVDSLLARVEADGVVLLLGEPGSGKTQLLRLLIDKASRRTIWLNIPRIATEAQANLLIDSLIRYLSPEAKGKSLRDRYAAAVSNFAGSVVVIEDLPRILPGGPLATQLETLAACLKNAQSTLLLSSYYALPASLRESLGNVMFDVPRFTEKDAKRSSACPRSRKLSHRSDRSHANHAIPRSSGVATAAVRYLLTVTGHSHQPRWNRLSGGNSRPMSVGPCRDAAADHCSLMRKNVKSRIRMSLAIGPFTQRM